jgi:hypothetical protein
MGGDNEAWVDQEQGNDGGSRGGQEEVTETAPSVLMETMKKVRWTDDHDKSKPVANDREERVTVAREQDRASGW